MQSDHLAFDEVSALSAFDKMYQKRSPLLRPFIEEWPSIQAISRQAFAKKKQHIDRALLVKVLTKQHHQIGSSSNLLSRIQKLESSDCFTVSTAHQLNLFTGPLYVIYKILSTIKTSQILSEQLGICVLPIYVMGSEDHDFEEINHCSIYGQKISWHTQQKGAIGRYAVDGIDQAINTLQTILKSDGYSKNIVELLQHSFTRFETYAQGYQYFVTQLFEKYSLIVLDMEDAELKQVFAPIMIEDAIDNTAYHLVGQTVKKLQAHTIKIQVNPRPINLFGLKANDRTRLVLDQDSRFRLYETDYSFSEEELKEDIKRRPQDWSPNVILRPLYQESILPNLAYIGGGGELAYWIELKSLFEHHDICFPLLLRRKSILWIDAAAKKRIMKLGLDNKNIFWHTDELVKYFLSRKKDFNLDDEQQKLRQMIDQISEKISALDQSLAKTSAAKMHHWTKDLHQIKSKAIKWQKQKYEIEVGQIKKLKERLFPKNGLQERRSNFLEFYPVWGSSYFDMLLEHIDPFDQDFLILEP